MHDHSTTCRTVAQRLTLVPIPKVPTTSSDPNPSMDVPPLLSVASACRTTAVRSCHKVMLKDMGSCEEGTVPLYGGYG